MYCHETNRAFACDICPNSFKTASVLRNHMKTHTRARKVRSKKGKSGKEKKPRKVESPPPEPEEELMEVIDVIEEVEEVEYAGEEVIIEDIDISEPKYMYSLQDGVLEVKSV